MRARLLSALVIPTLLAACASAQQTTPPPPDPAAVAAFNASPFLLAPGDRIEVIVRTAPELSRQLVIAPDGRVRLPYTGEITATGLSSAELSGVLSAELASELIDPSVDIIALELAPHGVFVAGEVRSPGLIDMPAPIGLSQAIESAGGRTRVAAPQTALLIRRLPGGEIRTLPLDFAPGQSAALNLPLRRFDIVVIPSAKPGSQDLAAREAFVPSLPPSFRQYFEAPAPRD